MKKVLIFYASYGGGHLTAAKAIQHYIDRHYESYAETSLVDCMKYVNKTVDKMTTFAYKEIAKKTPWLWGKVYYKSEKGLLSKFSSASNKCLSSKLLKLLEEYKPDLIISTHPFASQMCTYLKEKGELDCKIATIMTDFAPHSQWLVRSDYTDYFFVAHNRMKQALLEKDIDAFKVFPTGIPINSRFLESYDRSKLMYGFGLNENKMTILFFGGGEFGLGKNRTLNIFEALLDVKKDAQFIAISGKNEKMKAGFDEIVSRRHLWSSVKVLEYSDQIPEIMAVSDLVVTKPGGLTVSEALVSNVPMAIINPLPRPRRGKCTFLRIKPCCYMATKT